ESKVMRSSFTFSHTNLEDSDLQSPDKKRGVYTSRAALIRPHSFETLIAVRTLSPVHITCRICALLRVATTEAVVGLSLFSKTMNPKNVNSDSTCSRLTRWARRKFRVGTNLVAHAMTR